MNMERKLYKLNIFQSRDNVKDYYIMKDEKKSFLYQPRKRKENNQTNLIGN